MATDPLEIQFSFRAHSNLPDDTGGTAQWTVPLWSYGQWDTWTVEVDFKSFRDANLIQGILRAVWEAGIAEGSERCAARILNALAPVRK